MVVEVLAARNIEATDLLGTSDPYAVVSLGAQLCKTAVRPRTLKPVWAERFNIIAAKGELILILVRAIGLTGKCIQRWKRTRWTCRCMTTTWSVHTISSVGSASRSRPSRKAAGHGDTRTGSSCVYFNTRTGNVTDVFCLISVSRRGRSRPAPGVRAGRA